MIVNPNKSKEMEGKKSDVYKSHLDLHIEKQSIFVC